MPASPSLYDGSQLQTPRRPPQIPKLIRDLLVWGAGSGLPPGYVWCTGRVCFMVSIGRVRRCGAENGRAGGAKSTKIHPKCTQNARFLVFFGP